jgi:hypothetical protein
MKGGKFPHGLGISGHRTYTRIGSDEYHITLLDSLHTFQF